MSVDIYWRIAMEGEPSALRYGPAPAAGFAPHRPGTIAPSESPDDGFDPVDYMAEVVRATEAPVSSAVCCRRSRRPTIRGRRPSDSPPKPPPTGS